MRYRLAGAAAVGALTLVLAACGSDSDDGKADAGSKSEPGAFPVTIKHKFGSTTIKSEPKRIVTVGYNDHDFVLALGEKPVGIRDWVGVGPVTDLPWTRKQLAAIKPKVLSRNDLNVEQIALLKPDLIVGLFGGVTKRQYEALSKIAPVVAPPKEYVDFGVPWQEQALITGKALGHQAKAKALVTRLEGQFAKAREEHPEFKGKTAIVPYAGGGGEFGAYAGEDLRSRFVQELGFKTPKRVDQLAKGKFYIEFSGEQFRLMDQDAVLMLGAPRSKRKDVESDKLFTRLDAVKQGRVVYMDNEDLMLGAIGLSTPYSLPYALKEGVPRLAAAVDGDPATKVKEVR